MDFPASLMGTIVGEGEKYFFTVDCPIGVQEHIHICIKRHNRLLLFSTCSSQTDTAFRLAKLRGLDLSTFPMFTRNEINKFKRDITYIKCTNVIEISEAGFGQLIKEGKVHRIEGKLDEASMALIAIGVKRSKDVPGRIKDLF